MPQALTDVGTRYDHYRELLALWESTPELLEDHKRQSIKTKEKKQQLIAAIDILQKQIDVLSDYEDNTLNLRRVIREAHEVGTESKNSNGSRDAAQR